MTLPPAHGCCLMWQVPESTLGKYDTCLLLPLLLRCLNHHLSHQITLSHNHGEGLRYVSVATHPRAIFPDTPPSKAYIPDGKITPRSVGSHRKWILSYGQAIGLRGNIPHTRGSLRTEIWECVFVMNLKCG